MYGKCLGCDRTFGRNEVFESCPVGRRIAYDARSGRVWVLCHDCRTWNLVPIEERWEVVDAAQRLFETAEAGPSTENISLGELDDGTASMEVGDYVRGDRAVFVTLRGDACPARAARMLLLLALNACTGDRIVLTGDDGEASLQYRCADYQSALRDTQAVRVIADYSLRNARIAAERADTAALRELMRLYEQQDWLSLERNAVTRACAEGVIAPPALAFPSPGAPAPAFSLPQLLDSASVDLSALAGRIVVVDFWAPWCKPCVAQMPALERLASAYPDRVAVIAILHKDTPDRARRWLLDNRILHVLHLTDPEEATATRYRVFGLPTSFVLDDSLRVMRSVENPRLRMQVRELAASLAVLR